MRDRLSGLIGRIRTLTEEEVYRPNPGANCRFCDFQTLCSLWPEGAPVFPVAASSNEASASAATPPADADAEPREPAEPERAVDSEPAESEQPAGQKPASEQPESVQVTSWGQAAFPLEDQRIPLHA